MRIPVESIDDRGREVHVGLGDAWAVRAADTALDATPESLEAALRVERQGPIVRVHGQVRAGSTRPCDRCGEPVLLTVENEVELAYVPEKGGTGEHQLEEGELDTGTFAGDALDLSDVLAESIALALPPRVLCTDTEACDVRTSKLLAQAAAGDTSPFAGLAGLVRDH